MSATELAAWWGAGVASVVLVWDIFKWKRSSVAQIRVIARSNMQEAGLAGLVIQKFVYVEAANVGDKSTTVTHFGGVVFKTRWHRLLRRTAKSFAVLPSQTAQLPARLEPGDTWSGRIGQTEEIEKWSRDARLYVGIYHSLSNRPKLVRVIIPLRPKTE